MWARLFIMLNTFFLSQLKKNPKALNLCGLWIPQYQSYIIYSKFGCGNHWNFCSGCLYCCTLLPDIYISIFIHLCTLVRYIIFFLGIPPTGCARIYFKRLHLLVIHLVSLQIVMCDSLVLRIYVISQGKPCLICETQFHQLNSFCTIENTCLFY